LLFFVYLNFLSSTDLSRELIFIKQEIEFFIINLRGIDGATPSGTRFFVLSNGRFALGSENFGFFSSS
jgi:hypothetical protein